MFQAGFSSGNIKIVEEAAAVLQFCLHDKQHTGVTTLDDDTCTCNRKYIVVECEGEYEKVQKLTKAHPYGCIINTWLAEPINYKTSLKNNCLLTY